MDTLQRVLAMSRHIKGIGEDKFLASILAELEQRTDMQISSMVYTDQFRSFLDNLIGRFVDELERRGRMQHA